MDVQAPYVEGWVSLRDKVRSAVKSGASQVLFGFSLEHTLMFKHFLIDSEDWCENLYLECYAVSDIKREEAG